MLAMQRAVARLPILPMVFIDGNRCPTLPMRSQAVVKGEIRVAEISSASILAKVIRDREMAELDLVFPGYGFAQHKGYPTAFHLEAAGCAGGDRTPPPQFCPGEKSAGAISCNTLALTLARHGEPLNSGIWIWPNPVSFTCVFTVTTR